MAPPKSIIWTHFTKTNETIAKCKHCFKSVKYCGNTSNLFKHSKTHGISVDKGTLQKEENKGTKERYDPKTFLVLHCFLKMLNKK